MNKRTHNNAEKRVYRILHTQGELKGQIEEIHGRAFYEGIEKGALVREEEGQKFARLAPGWLAHIVSKTEVAFLRFVKMVSNWEIIEKVFIYSGALGKDAKDQLMRASQPLIGAEQFRIGDSRVNIGTKKNKRFVRQINFASTAPVY